MQIIEVEMPEIARFRTKMFFGVLCIFFPETLKIIFPPLEFQQSLNKEHKLDDDVTSSRAKIYVSMTITTLKKKLFTLLLSTQ